MDMTEDVAALREQVTRYKTQRDELLAVLKGIEEYLASSPYATDSAGELREVRAALAKFEDDISAIPEWLAQCDCDQQGNPDVLCHASDCVGRQKLEGGE